MRDLQAIVDDNKRGHSTARPMVPPTAPQSPAQVRERERVERAQAIERKARLNTPWSQASQAQIKQDIADLRLEQRNLGLFDGALHLVLGYAIEALEERLHNV